MLIFNITTKVDPDVDRAWLQWQQEEHIPEIIATGFFTGCQLCRLLEQDDKEGNTYIIQYTAAGAEQYYQYITVCSPLLRRKAAEKWGNKIISFRSVMEVIQ